MSKTSELSQVLDEMITCGEKMIVAANAIKEIFSSTEKTTTPAEKSDKSVTQKPKFAKAYDFADVRKAFAAKSHDGYTDQVKSLIKKYKAEKLSDISKEDYPDLMADLEAIK